MSDTTYHIAVKTGDIPGGSSDSDVFVKLYGEKGDTSKMMLVVSANNLGNYFETGRVDIFRVDTFDIGQVCSCMFMLMYSTVQNSRVLSNRLSGSFYLDTGSIFSWILVPDNFQRTVLFICQVT